MTRSTRAEDQGMSGIAFIRRRRGAVSLVLLISGAYVAGVLSAAQVSWFEGDYPWAWLVAAACYVSSVMVIAGQPRRFWKPGEESKTLTVIGILTVGALTSGVLWLVRQRGVEVSGVAAVGLIVAVLVSGTILACWPPINLPEDSQ